MPPDASGKIVLGCNTSPTSHQLLVIKQDTVTFHYAHNIGLANNIWLKNKVDQSCAKIDLAFS